MQTEGGDTGIVHQSALHMTFTCQFSEDLEVPWPFRKTDAFLPSGHRPTMSRSNSCVDWPTLLGRCLTFIFVRMGSTASVFRAAGFLLMLLADLVGIV